MEWQLRPAVIDGTPVIAHWKKAGDEWHPHSAIRLWWEDGKVVRITSSTC